MSAVFLQWFTNGAWHACLNIAETWILEAATVDELMQGGQLIIPVPSVRTRSLAISLGLALSLAAHIGKQDPASGIGV